MSAGVPTSGDDTPKGAGRADYALPGLRRPAGALAAAAFWGWLVARWVNDWVLPRGVGLPRGRSFVPQAPFAAASRALRSIAGELAAAGGLLGRALAGTAAWLADAVDAVAFAVGALPALAQGVWLTLLLTMTSIAIGFCIAVPLSVARVYGGPLTRWISLSYTELIRGTPLLAQLFVLYFGLGLTRYVRAVPGVGQGSIPDQAVWVAIIGFVINSSAYQSEYIRSAILSVEAGQLTAARAIGLSKFEGIRHVVLPQGLRFAIPGWSNELVYLIKYSSLAAFITVPELYFRANDIASETFRYTAMFTLVALMYLALVVSASTLMTIVEARLVIPGLGQSRLQ